MKFVIWSFFLLRLLFISINLSNGLAWNTVVLCGLVLLAAALVKLQKPVCRTVGFSLAISLKPLALPWNAARLSLFCSITLFICTGWTGSAFLLSWEVHSFFCVFFVTIHTYCKDIYIYICISLFSRTARHWNSLLEKCFLLM